MKERGNNTFSHDGKDKAFYQNRWYNYEKPENDIRSEYNFLNKNHWILESYMNNMKMRITFVVFLLLVWQVYDYF